MRVLLGYDILPGFTCPSCGQHVALVEDEGDPVSVRVRCWCGANGLARRDDPDMVKAIGETA